MIDPRAAALFRARVADRSAPVGLAFSAILLVFLGVNLVRRDLYAFSPAVYWFFDVVKFVVVPTAAAFVLARRYATYPSEYGLRPRIGEGWMRFGGLTVFLVLTLNLAYHATQSIALHILRPDAPAAFYQEINPTGVLRVPATLYMAVTAGVVEEVFFRGLPLLYLERRFPGAVPRVAYVVVTALLFGAVHWTNGPHEFIGTFVFGLLAAAIYLRLRDLWPLIAAHAVIDLYDFA